MPIRSLLIIHVTRLPAVPTTHNMGTAQQGKRRRRWPSLMIACRACSARPHHVLARRHISDRPAMNRTPQSGSAGTPCTSLMTGLIVDRYAGGRAVLDRCMQLASLPQVAASIACVLSSENTGKFCTTYIVSEVH
jgi:hypothetical protein